MPKPTAQDFHSHEGGDDPETGEEFPVRGMDPVAAVRVPLGMIAPVAVMVTLVAALIVRAMRVGVGMRMRAGHTANIPYGRAGSPGRRREESGNRGRFPARNQGAGAAAGVPEAGAPAPSWTAAEMATRYCVMARC